MDWGKTFFIALFLMTTTMIFGCSDNQTGNDEFFLKEIEDRLIVADAFRPDVVGIDGSLFLAYNSGVDQKFHLIVLDQNLDVVKESVNIYSGERRVTDIRVATDYSGNFWYAFESVEGTPGCGNHYVNAAIYVADLDLLASKDDLSTGCTSGSQRQNIPTSQIPLNPQAADDPTPFFNDGKYYILTRSWLGPIQEMNVYDERFGRSDDFSLDISEVFDKENMLSQNVMIDMENQIYIIGGIAKGPPIQRIDSSIYAIPLGDGLEGFKGSPVRLTGFSGEYDTRVTSAHYADGILYINYHDLRAAAQYFEAFDVKNDFQSLGRVKFQEGLVGDGHSSFAVIDDKIYLFYVDTQNKVRSKIIQIGDKGAMISVKTTKSSQDKGFVEMNNASNPPSQKGIDGGRCGDGVCDDFESDNPGLCSIDC